MSRNLPMLPFAKHLSAKATISVGFLVVFAAAVLSASDMALAIPSPELVVGSISGLSQLAALLSALLGGGVIAAGVGTNQRRQMSQVKAGAKASDWTSTVFLLLSLAVCGLLAGNVYLYVSHQNEEQSRLEATLLRSTPKTIDGKTLDSSLKVRSYRQQLAHSQGISTARVADLLTLNKNASDKTTMFIDIREAVEAEMGTLPGAQNIRFPDLVSSKSHLDNTSLVLFCHNGNRSSETCEKFRDLGIDCSFIVGGLEKWLVEGRSLHGRQARSLQQLRALPSFPNQTELLTTKAVKGILADENAVFVDVRYPGEFASGHLPGAINLPIRPTPSDVLKQKIASLPDQPIIAPCYDRRSCFYGEILGLLVSRAGGDFRGRYTEPWSYAKPRELPPHVIQWRATLQQSYWTRAGKWLADQLLVAARDMGLPLAIFLLALLSRLFILPFAVKADRDSIVSRNIRPQLDALKKKLKDEPARRARAIRHLYRENNLTPLRNLIALAFLPVLALCIEGVIGAAERSPVRFVWIDNIAQPDPLYVLPTVGALLFSAYLHFFLARKTWHRSVIWAVVTPLLWLTVSWLPSAGGLYLVISAVLLILQRIIFAPEASVGVEQKLSSRNKRRWLWPGSVMRQPGVMRLQDVREADGAGNKATRLARLINSGYDVPNGILLSHEFLALYAQKPPSWQKHICRRLWRKMAAKKIAVRSSALGEDGASSSFAGVFETALNVDRAGFKDAVDDVMAAFTDPRTRAYGNDAGHLNIILQPMIDPDYAGVMFTEDPLLPASQMIELVEGIGDDLVSGRKAPETYRFGRLTAAPQQSARPPIDLTPLLEVGKRIEALFGRPQDIEWAFKDGRFVVLQTRDITVLESSLDDVRRNEWRRIFELAAKGDGSKARFVQNEMAEMLPRPTPLSLSLLEKMWQAGGSIDTAMQRLGISYFVSEQTDAYHVTLFGRLYLDMQQVRSRRVLITKGVARKLRRNADKIEGNFRNVVLANIEADLLFAQASNFQNLPTEKLLQACRMLMHTFLDDIHVEVDIINIAAKFYIDDARQCLSDANIDPATALQCMPSTGVKKALQRTLLAPADRKVEEFRRVLGHRANLDYELSIPRYSENEQELSNAVEVMLDAIWHREELNLSHLTSDEEQLSALPKKVRQAVLRARKFQVLKEDAKHESLRVYAVLRALALAIDERLDLAGCVFHLTTDELVQLSSNTIPGLKARARARQQRFESFKSFKPLPAELSVADLEHHCSIAMGEGGVTTPANDDVKSADMRGTCVSGSHPAEGRVIVVPSQVAETGGKIDGFQKGDVIAASMIHPSWLPEVIASSGVISEVGGWLSHMAIVAREHDITMIVGVNDIDVLATGDFVSLEKSGEIRVQKHQDVSHQDRPFAQAAE